MASVGVPWGLNPLLCLDDAPPTEGLLELYRHRRLRNGRAIPTRIRSIVRPVRYQSFSDATSVFHPVHTFLFTSIVRPSRISISSPCMLVLTIWQPFFGLVL